MLSFEGINFLAVIVAGIVYFVLGAVWYSPLLFAKQFIRFRGGKPEEIQGNPADYGITFVVELVSALVLALIINVANPTNDAVQGALIGAVVGLGIAAASSLVFTIYSGPHRGLWVIYAGYQLAAFIVMGVILSVWV